MIDFPTFFRAIHGHCPFPWQEMLAAQVTAKGRWPKLIDLPTASGKTACLDVAVWAMAKEAAEGVGPQDRRMPRRVWLVVDRRIVVDEAAKRAEKIRDAIDKAPELADVKKALFELRGVKRDGGLPLAVARLRGGDIGPTDEHEAAKRAHNDSWQTVPTQPAILLSTVDQLGSRLLFRGYGMSPGFWPIHAALAGYDSLILLDEAHIAEPLRQTLDWVARHRHTATEPIPTPWHFAFMTATPGQLDTDDAWPVFPSREQRTEALRHAVLQQRRDASKRATLDMAPGEKRDEKLLAAKVGEHVRRLLDGGRTRVAVMLNRVDSAVGVADALKTACQKGGDAPRVDLLTGRMRPIDRTGLVDDLEKVFAAKLNRPPLDGPPRILVTTQCLEVGADFDFDGLVTECASLDALRQRFGRLDRLGETKQTDAAIITVAPDVKEPDPIYGEGLLNTHAWLHGVADAGVVDFGIAALDAKLDPAIVPSLLGPKPDAPVLMPAYLDAWCQTGPRPAVEAEVSLFLHGVQDDVAEVSVVFRGDLPESLKADEIVNLIRLCPPAPGEMLPVKLGRLRAWRTGGKLPAEGDVPGIEEKPTLGKDKEVPPPTRMVRYLGGRETEIEVLDINARLKPGDVIIVPLTGEEMPSALGSKPEGAKLDRFEEANALAGRRPTTRVFDEIAVHLLERLDRPADQAEVDDPADDKTAALAALSKLIPDDFPKPLQLRDKRGDWQYHAHPAGGVIVIGPPRPRRPKVDPFADPDDLLAPPPESTDHDRLLSTHQRLVASFAGRFAQRCVPVHRESIVSASDHHDDGKADARFYALLEGSTFAVDPDPARLLAKSDGPRSPDVERRLRERLGIPQGFRHEFLSMQLAARREGTADLVLHLIAAHHGHARPFAPVVFDDDPPDAMLGNVLINGKDRKDNPSHALGSGVAERFWRLTRAHGWWGLAYLEAMVRLADHHASRFPAADAEEANDA